MYSSIYSQQQIRDFYSSTSFNLHNYFETSKIGEIENLQKQVKRPTDDSVANITSIQIKEIESLLSGNSKNKNVSDLKKCLDVIEKQTVKLIEKKKELTLRLDTMVRNTIEDIKRIKLEEGSGNIFEVELTNSIFQEKSTCKQKFKNYLERAKLVLEYKKEMSEIGRVLISELEKISEQLKEYYAVVENIKVSVETIILPEIMRRKEFDQLNREYTSFYWNWITKETESRENFIDRGDLQQLPYAFKKILVSFIFDEDFDVDVSGNRYYTLKDIDSLNIALKSYFERWTKSPEEGLKGKLADYLNENNRIKDQVAALASQLEMASNDLAKEKERSGWMIEEKEKEIVYLKNKTPEEAAIREPYEVKIKELKDTIEVLNDEKDSLEVRLRSTIAELNVMKQKISQNYNEISRVQNTHDEEKRDLTRLIEKLKMKIEDDSNNYAESERIISGLQKKEENERTAARLLQDSIEDLERLNSSILKKLDLVTKEADQKVAENKNLIEMVQKLEVSLDRMIKCKESLENEVKVLKISQQSDPNLEEEVNLLRQELKDALQERDENEEKIILLEADLEQIKRKDTEDDLLKTVTEHNSDINAINEALKETVQDYENTFKDQNSTIKSLEKKITNFEEQIKRIQNNQTQVSTADARKDSLDDELKNKMKERINELESEIKRMKETQKSKVDSSSNQIQKEFEVILERVDQAERKCEDLKRLVKVFSKEQLTLMLEAYRNK